MAQTRFQALSLPAVGRLLVIPLVSLVVACGGGTKNDGEEIATGGFISHVPGQSSANGDGDGDAADADGSATEASSDDSAERAISEADIIQVDGDRLFALSRFSGLSIIDIGDPTDLQLLGRYRSSANPFEMYLEGDVAYIMYNGWNSYVYDEESDSYRWEATSRMQAIDVSDPATPKKIGDEEVPGSIADSRKVGDIIYLATHQTNWCWRCDDAANSRVTSFDVSDPSKFTPVDSAVFQTEDGWQRSISVTTERIYISGWTWTGDDNQGATIDVVDISDPNGTLKKGTSVEVAGQIESRWQMDEFDGTLRVISQPGGWGTTTPPVVETFQVNSADDIQPLASLDMVLPRPEDLRSVRFDGDRAFAITFERTDPLFTFDLSDPANPLQLGELEIPGWVYHMEPRGDLIYALGFDNTNDAGSLHVSLFDVSDMNNPIQLDRVNFGSDWGGFAEDQDRIHKAFTILEDENLILVPFHGGGYDELSCRYNYQSGIQLVDIGEGSLEKRGVAPQTGSARRALFHDGSLFGIGDNAVQSFDITDRDNPEKLDQLDTARNVTNIKLMGDTMLRFGRDWWTDQAVLDFTDTDDVDVAMPLGELDLNELVDNHTERNCEDGESYYHEYSRWSGQVFVHGGYAYVPRYHQVEQEIDDKWTWTNTLAFFIVDIRDQAAPKVIGEFELEPTNGDIDEYYAGIVQTDGALLVGRGSGYYSYNPFRGERREVEFYYDVIDLGDPASPEVVDRFEVPNLLSSGGWGYGIDGCSVDLGWGWWGYGWGGYGGGSQNALVSGDLVLSQHEEPVNDGTGRVRYYLDRIDVSNPASPKLLTKVNIPGNVVHFDGDENRIVTIDYLLDERPAKDWDDCRDDATGVSYGYFDDEDNVCRNYRRRLNVLDLQGDTAILRDSRDIDREGAPARSIAISDDRVFFNVVTPSTVHEDEPPTSSVHVLSYNSAGDIRKLGEVDMDKNGWWWGRLVARDGRAFMTMDNEMTVIDATSSDVSVERHEMPGWWCNQLEVQNDTAYCSMGQYGVLTVPLD